MKLSFAFLFVVLFAGKSFSQSWNTDSSNNPASDTTNNLSTVDGIIGSLYNSISGPAGEQRNWDTFRSLFADNAAMYIAVNDKDSGEVLKTITPEEYIQRNEGRMPDIGYSEKELYRITNSYGAGTQVFSTYESNYTNSNGEEQIVKGINSIQLFFDGQRYYIISIFWDSNSKNIQVPDRYLPKQQNTKYELSL